MTTSRQATPGGEQVELLALLHRPAGVGELTIDEHA